MAPPLPVLCRPDWASGSTGASGGGDDRLTVTSVATKGSIGSAGHGPGTPVSTSPPESMTDHPPDPGSRSGLNPARIRSEAHLEQVRQNWRHNWEERRSHQRYPLDNPFSCNLQLDSGLFPPMPVQLKDVSLGGACLLISSLVDLRRGEMGELRSHATGRDGLDRRRLRICWQDVREWITAVGVAFEPPLQALPQELELR